MKFKSLERAIEYLEAIPEDKWCRDVIENLKGQKCFLGHIGFRDDLYPRDTPHAHYNWNLLTSSGVDMEEVINYNNEHPKGPKIGTLTALKSYLK